MKKLLIIMLSFFAVSCYSQARFERIKITDNVKRNDATRVIVQDSITKQLNWILKSSIGGTSTDPTKLAILNNLSDLNNVTTARTNLGLGTLATQSGTFSSKANDADVVKLTGDQSISGIKFFNNDLGLDSNLSISGGGSLIFNQGTFITQINATTLTANRGVDFPDASGTVALTSDLAALDAGVVKLTTNQTIAGEKTFNNKATFNDAYIREGYGLYFPSGPSYFAKFLTNTLTANTVVALPNASGTIALTSDVAAKQNILVSGTNIKTINSTSLLGSGDVSTILAVTETGASFSLTDAYNGKVVIITASCTVTVPNGLISGFECSFITLTGATVTISLGGSVVLFNNAGLTMAEKLSFTLKNRTATNNYITVGNL